MKNFKHGGDRMIFRTGNEGRIVEIDVHYMKADNLKRRGIYISIDHKTVTPATGPGGYSSVSHVLLAGVTVFVKQLDRKTDKELTKATIAIDEQAPALAKLFDTDKQQAKDALTAIFAPATVTA